MTRTLLTSVAAGAILLGAAVAPVAYAQDTTQPQTSPSMETQPATPDTSANPAKPMNNAQTTAPSTDTNMASKDKTYLTEQSPDQISANTYIGQSVYNGSDESIGKINDLIMEKSGGITAAVIGVGGFLGIGEKWVAVPFENISVNQAADGGDMKLTTTETAETLQAAPEFKTLKQVANRDNNTAVDTTSTSSTTNNTTTNTTTPPPATEPAK